MDVQTKLAELRSKRGLGASELAARVGVSRQTVYAIEAGTYVPNTAVSLKLARALDATVEEIFQLEPEDQASDKVVEATLLGDPKIMIPGQPLRVCAVAGHIVAVAPEPGSWGFPTADAALVEVSHGAKRNAKAKVRMLGDRWKRTARILIAGCDPSVSILAQSLQSLGCELLVAYENSSQSLELLHEGLAHVAGTHLIDKATGKADLLPITSLFGRSSVAVFSYAIWDEGLVMALGNPKRISGVSDLARGDVRFTNREAGAGCRRLLDEQLREAGIAPGQVNGYERITEGHLPAARLVKSSEVDCCVSTNAVARALGLDFIPLASKPYHLVIRRTQLNYPPIQALLDTLGRASFRHEVEACTGYDMKTAGDRLV